MTRSSTGVRLDATGVTSGGGGVGDKHGVWKVGSRYAVHLDDEKALSLPM